VAVSGGSDSTALLLLLHAWAGAEGRALHAVTVDHALRPESANETAKVSRLCQERDIPHDILCWTEKPLQGNLQEAARDARRALIAGWAGGRGLSAVALGHTLDDQAETVLMRLSRGSGVDGLAAMVPVREAEGVLWLRPLLTLRRAALRNWLAAQGVGWCEDPSNDDRRFARVRARQALEHLAPLGLTPERLAATAARMAVARAALEADTRSLAGVCVRAGVAGDLLLDPAPLVTAPREVALRLLASALMWVSGERFRPRLVRLQAALDAIVSGPLGAGRTLHGCVIRPARGGLAIRRELSRVESPVPIKAGRWDNRWELVEGPQTNEFLIGAVGKAGLDALPRWRKTSSAPREALLATPALWDGATLIAAPLVAAAGPWRFQRIAAVPSPVLQPQ
jgi:tRNA(Ile)-lysidine synthase